MLHTPIAGRTSSDRPTGTGGRSANQRSNWTPLPETVGRGVLALIALDKFGQHLKEWPIVAGLRIAQQKMQHA